MPFKSYICFQSHVLVKLKLSAVKTEKLKENKNISCTKIESTLGHNAKRTFSSVLSTVVSIISWICGEVSRRNKTSKVTSKQFSIFDFFRTVSLSWARFHSLVEAAFPSLGIELAPGSTKVHDFSANAWMTDASSLPHLDDRCKFSSPLGIEQSVLAGYALPFVRQTWNLADFSSRIAFCDFRLGKHVFLQDRNVGIFTSVLSDLMNLYSRTR